MRKILLFSTILISAYSYSQVVFNVTSPASISGSYDFTNQGDGSDWGLANLLSPSVAVLDTVVIADDGTPGLNPQGNPIAWEACNAITNNVAGKIVMVYRNTCSFGIKCLNAQNAGAVGVIVVNREPGLVNMAGGAEGLLVNIPVTFISSTDGALIQQRIAAGETVTVFIGNKTGLFANDVGITKTFGLIPRAAAEYNELARNANDYTVTLGTWVLNYGSATQNNVTAKVEVFYNGTSVYTQTSAPFSLQTDSASFITFAPFSQAAYPAGEYTITYTAILANDEFPFDNSISSKMVINTQYYGIAAIDPTTLLAANVSATRVANPSPLPTNTSFSACIAFRDANANRVRIKEVRFQSATRAGSTTAPDLIGQIVDVNILTWDDVFTDVLDATYNNFTTVASEPYIYTADLQNQEVSVEFSPAIALTNNQRYLVCVNTLDPDVFFGFDRQTNYRRNENTAGFQPVMALEVFGDWSSGFTTPIYPAIFLKFENTGIGLDELEVESVNVYPNPASYVVNIPMKGWEGNVAVKAHDITGKMVMDITTGQIHGEVLTVDVSNFSTGTYVFTMASESGRMTSFTVMINR